MMKGCSPSSSGASAMGGYLTKTAAAIPIVGPWISYYIGAPEEVGGGGDGDKDQRLRSVLAHAHALKQAQEVHCPTLHLLEQGGDNSKSTRAPAAFDPADFCLRGLVGQTVVREPGAINGQPFAIEKCANCDIYLLDWLAQITIDDCVDCRIVVGPCEGSVFVRDCARCAVVVACQQFRTRGCAEIDVWLFAGTPPIIESTHRARFGCYTLGSYAGLQQQFARAGLDVDRNRWWEVYDFTPDEVLGGTSDGETEPHFRLMPAGERHGARIRPLPREVVGRVGYSEGNEGEESHRCLVPYMAAPAAAAVGKHK